MKILAALFVISLLVIIHEFGHYIVARAFGMRVLTYSIGFGPVIARWRPKGSETVFQIAAIPVLAYVQIAGMNPREENDPRDRGSYQNATPLARFMTIAAGPLANFLAAGLVLFFIAAAGGEAVGPPNAHVGRVMPSSPAGEAGLRGDDVVRSMNGTPVASWEELVRRIGESQRRPLTIVRDGAVVRSVNGEETHGWWDVTRVLAREARALPIQLQVERNHQLVDLTVTPRLNYESGRFLIGIGPRVTYRSVGIGRSIEAGVVQPAAATRMILVKLGELFHHSDDIQLMGPVGIVSATVSEAEKGWRDGLEMVAAISLQLFIFNLLPIPALDGGRLLVLGYEMVTKRRPNPKIEARVLGYSLMLMLGLFLVVTSREIWGLISNLFSRSRG